MWSNDQIKSGYVTLPELNIIAQLKYFAFDRSSAIIVL